MQSPAQDRPPFPDGFFDLIKPLLQDDFAAFLASCESEPVRALRFRSMALKNDHCHCKSVPWEERAVYYTDESSPGTHPLHEAGLYYIQEASAMAPVAALSPEPGDRVLDLCASPGGKSTQIAACLQGSGTLVCNEPVYARAKTLSRNIERFGVNNAVVTCALPEQLSALWSESFNKILVDAPCSGEGMFRKHPETRLSWQKTHPAGCAVRQKHILNHAALMLAPGGSLVYSTCTFNRIENEDVVEAFLHDHPDFELSPFELNGLPPSSGTLRLWPHQVEGEGHFVARFVKKGIDMPFHPTAIKPLKQDLTLISAMAEALPSLLQHSPANLSVINNTVVSAPASLPPLEKVQVLRLGLHLGYIKGKVVMPDHAAALACTAAKTMDLTEEQARAFQHGDVLPLTTEESGWLAPRLMGQQLGWGKAVDGVLKNHYPKGLRR